MKSITKALEYIQSQQNKSGGFTSFSKDENGKKLKRYQTTFFPSLILSAIKTSNKKTALNTKQRIKTFLLKEAGPNYSFNYWTRESHEYTSLPYPSDLDDTFVALHGLFTYSPELISGKILGNVAKLLVATESKEGGPYKTWLIDESAAEVWKDTDLAVNSNVAKFLATQNIHLPSISKLLDLSLRTNNLSSPYYIDDYPIFYSASSWVQGKQREELVDYVLRKEAKTPQQLALKTISLINLGYDKIQINELSSELIQYQNKDGSWPAENFCIDPSIDNQKRFASSTALTTAFCIEALNLLSNSPSKKTTPNNKVTTYYTTVVKSLEKDVAKTKNIELKQSLQTALNKILDIDKDKQILALPYMIAKNITAEINPRIPFKLAKVSAWGWIAYTIYDDFLDQEGDKFLLPAANVCMRNMLTTLRGVQKNNIEFQKKVMTLLERIDAANCWEIAHCRKEIKDGMISCEKLPDYKDYWQLADRSIGHSISALGVLYTAGHSSTSPQVLGLEKFFIHYLTARQLNDDAHDWKDDLKQGHVNSVAVKILEKSKNKKIQLDSLAEPEKILWESVIDTVSSDILQHAQQARQALNLSKLNLAELEALLTPLENAAKLALTERDRAQDFIKSFSG